MTEVRALEKKHQNIECSSAAPAEAQQETVEPSPELHGQLTDIPCIPESQYWPTVPTFDTGPPTITIPRCSPGTLYEALHGPVATATSQERAMDHVHTEPEALPEPIAAANRPSQKRKNAVNDSDSESTRKTHTCRKCGLPMCKGVGRVDYCINLCRDCQEMGCCGCNSKWPLKDCKTGRGYSFNKKLKR